MNPLFSILLIAPTASQEALALAARSVVQQTCEQWELIIATSHVQQAVITDWLNSEKDDRIRCVSLPGAPDFTTLANHAAEHAQAPLLGLLFAGDELSVDALSTVQHWLIQRGDADVVYSDEKIIDSKGYITHCFKPDYSPEFLGSMNYISHFLLFKKALFEKVGGLHPGFDGAETYDLTLRLTEQAQRVLHIPRVLYSWREQPHWLQSHSVQNTVSNSGIRALQAHYQRLAIPAQVHPGFTPYCFDSHIQVQGNPKVSIIIPFKDKPELLDQCINSIIQFSGYANWEVIGLSNNSTQPETHQAMARWQQTDSRVRFVEHNQPFNYSQLQNLGAELATGDYLLLLNNDIQFYTPNTLYMLLSYAQLPQVGAVGAKLLFPDNRIQHCGITLGIGGLAANCFCGLTNTVSVPLHRNQVPSNFIAVTGAMLMIEKRKYWAINGFDEQLVVEYNDVDFGVRLHQAGYRNVVLPQCVAYHHESATRGNPTSEQNIRNHNNDVARFIAKYASLLKGVDPFYNENFSKRTPFAPQSDAEMTFDPISMHHAFYNSSFDPWEGSQHRKKILSTKLPFKSKLSIFRIKDFASLKKTLHITIDSRS